MTRTILGSRGPYQFFSTHGEGDRIFAYDNAASGFNKLPVQSLIIEGGVWKDGPGGTPVPEWGGQPVRMAQEEDFFVGADGKNRWAFKRQSELHIVR